MPSVPRLLVGVAAADDISVAGAALLPAPVLVVLADDVCPCAGVWIVGVGIGSVVARGVCLELSAGDADDAEDCSRLNLSNSSASCSSVLGAGSSRRGLFRGQLI